MEEDLFVALSSPMDVSLPSKSIAIAGEKKKKHQKSAEEHFLFPFCPDLIRDANLNG
jgi:hypothetical protein